MLNSRIFSAGVLAIVTDRDCSSFTGGLRASVTRTYTDHPMIIATALFTSRLTRARSKRDVGVAARRTIRVRRRLVIRNCVGGNGLARGCFSRGGTSSLRFNRIRGLRSFVVGRLSGIFGPSTFGPTGKHGGARTRLIGSGFGGGR